VSRGGESRLCDFVVGRHLKLYMVDRGAELDNDSKSGWFTEGLGKMSVFVVRSERRRQVLHRSDR